MFSDVSSDVSSDVFSDAMAYLVDLVWGPQLVALLFWGGIYLFIRSKGQPLRRLGLGLKLAFGLSHFGVTKKSVGQLSHFQALSNALAATIGLGNIAGVAVAITQGGPGALLWIWVSGFIGMNTKFYESSLALMYRGKDALGEVQGGPMYYIPQIIKGRWGKILAIFFALAGLIGTQAMFQANQLASYLESEASLSPYLTGVFLAIFSGIVLMGGLKRIALVTSTLVPVMCVLYVFMSMGVIVLNYSKIPSIFYLIFSEAFSLESIGGGVLGYAIIQAFQIGIRRGGFSNEAGIGTAPMAHGNAKTSEPVSEGLVSMIGPLLDSVIVCTMTALVILLTTDLSQLDPNKTQGIQLTTEAFFSQYGYLGAIGLGICVFFFSISTVVGMSNYNEKCWLFIFRERFIFKKPLFIVTFCMFLFLAAIGNIEDVVNILDIGYGLMAYPNMLAVLLASALVTKEIRKKL